MLICNLRLLSKLVPSLALTAQYIEWISEWMNICSHTLQLYRNHDCHVPLLYPQQLVQCLGHGSLCTNRLKEAFKRWVLGSILLLIMPWHPYCKSKKHSPVDSRESGMEDRARWWKSSGSTAVPGRGTTKKQKHWFQKEISALKK